MNFRAMFAGFLIGLLPRRWRRWVLSTIAVVVIVAVSFFVDALNTPSDPTIEQYTGHSGRTSLLVVLGAVWVLGTLFCALVASHRAHRPQYVPFPASTEVVETTAVEADDTWVREEWARYHAEQAAAEDPDAEYKILRAAAEQLEALKRP